jgi:hypothetical protein
MSMQHGGMIMTEENKVVGEQPVPVPLRPPQISYALPWDWTQASMVKDQQLTTWSTVQLGPLVTTD